MANMIHEFKKKVPMIPEREKKHKEVLSVSKDVSNYDKVLTIGQELPMGDQNSENCLIRLHIPKV